MFRFVEWESNLQPVAFTVARLHLGGTTGPLLEWYFKDMLCLISESKTDQETLDCTEIYLYQLI